MNLNEYQWSGNPRGMHWDFGTRGVNATTLRQHGFGILKLVTVGGPETPIGDLLANGITPIARIYRPRMGSAPPDGAMMQQFSEYLAAGVKWFELYNEPNLENEWPAGADYNPNNPGVIAPMMENWLNWAEFIINNGGYPGLTAFAETTGAGHINYWVNNTLRYLFDNHYDRFRNILNNGCYISAHPYVLNHFYQEQIAGGPLSARPPEGQNMNQGGWHFEYPFDPISQRDKPGVGIWGAPGGEVGGLIISGQMYLERLSEMFGVGAIPVMGTEGGLFVPNNPNDRMGWDDRYPQYSWESHAHATMAMFDWILHSAPPWLFGVALWTSSHYFSNPNGQPPAVAAFLGRRPGYKTVPPLPALGSAPTTVSPGVVATAPPPGPGPVHGTPTYHFFYLAPGIPPDWFFNTAQPYWERFLPTLLDDLSYVGHLTYDVSLALSVIAPAADADEITQQVIQQWPSLKLDMIRVTSQAELQARFAERVASGNRFGG